MASNTKYLSSGYTTMRQRNLDSRFRTISRRRGARNAKTKRINVVQLLIATIAFMFFVGLFASWVVFFKKSTVILKAPEFELPKAPEAPPAASLTIPSPIIEEVRNQFYERYGGSGGKEAAEKILTKGIKAYGESVEASAHRMLTAAASETPFVLAFAGYSVTVGRGNFYKQSFPFCLERIIKPVLKKSILALDVVVRNAAIGGIPSFPYAFCFEHFLGSDPDVVSWDYSMNEGNGASILESYVRQSQHQLDKRPMLIALDTNVQRCKLLEQYVEKGVLKDALCLAKGENVVPSKGFLTLPDDQKPTGFRNWKEFGAPDTCPGRGNWHPRKQEHELLGWMLAMYFLRAIEHAEKIIQKDPRWRQTYATPADNKGDQRVAAVQFPPTIHDTPANNKAVTGLLYGHNSGGGSDKLIMKDISCRTNFLPAQDNAKVLGSVVVSGLNPHATVSNIMEKRTDDHYKEGWVLDVSNVERETKVKVEKCGGLGYVDMKIALYGSADSGTLRLWLPAEGRTHIDVPAGSNEAKNWFHGLVLCEANEKRPADACQLDKDIKFTVGSVQLSATNITMVKGAAEYLKRKTCISLDIPDAATITKLGNVVTVDGKPLSEQERMRLLGGDNTLANTDNHVGLVVDVEPAIRVSRDKGACCLSHIVWEQH